jgi:hypothetical protein
LTPRALSSATTNGGVGFFLRFTSPTSHSGFVRNGAASFWRFWYRIGSRNFVEMFVSGKAMGDRFTGTLNGDQATVLLNGATFCPGIIPAAFAGGNMAFLLAASAVTGAITYEHVRVTALTYSVRGGVRRQCRSTATCPRR